MEETVRFDLEVVLHAFTTCQQQDESLLLVEYLVAYRELYRFFKLLGRIFGFVAKDIDEKITIIEARMNNQCDTDHYKTVQSMLVYELTSNIANTRGRLPSGSRSLLRLHRALEFILLFMTRIARSAEDAKIPTIAAEAYGQTLAKHHNWFVKNMTYLAVRALPSRSHIVDMICKQKEDEVLSLLEEVCQAGKTVYDVTQKLYLQHEMLDLR